jgi:hypothetical protein
MEAQFPPFVLNSRGSLDQYEIIDQVGQGTYGVGVLYKITVLLLNSSAQHILFNVNASINSLSSALLACCELFAMTNHISLVSEFTKLTGSLQRLWWL